MSLVKQDGPLLVELRMGSFEAIRGQETSLGEFHRTSEGALTESSRREFVEGLRRLLPVGRSNAMVCHCAVPGTGVLLHRVRMPKASREETLRLLRLRIESEFPLAPDELAWGYAEGVPEADGSREYFLAAVRKSTLAEYETLFRPLGFTPIFSVASLARVEMLPDRSTSASLLDVGPRDAELVVAEQGHAVSIRGIAAGSKTGGFSWSDALRRHGRAIQGQLWVSGLESGSIGVDGLRIQNLKSSNAIQPSLALQGLRQLAEEKSSSRLIPLNVTDIPRMATSSDRWPIKWIALAAALLIGLWLMPFLEAILRRPGLEQRVTATRNEVKKLGLIDREFEFLRHLELNQPPYIEALYLVAQSAPPGLRLDSTSMNRRGELAVKGKAPGMQQLGELQSKLIDSGFFSSVVVDDQTADQNRQVQFRLSGKWKNPEDRENLKIGPVIASTNSSGGTSNVVAGAPKTKGSP